jgi:hypothetical protein
MRRATYYDRFDKIEKHGTNYVKVKVVEVVEVVLEV